MSKSRCCDCDKPATTFRIVPLVDLTHSALYFCDECLAKYDRDVDSAYELARIEAEADQ